MSEEIKRLTKQRDELAKAFVEIYDGLWNCGCGEWDIDHCNLSDLREKLRKEASGEAKG